MKKEFIIKLSKGKNFTKAPTEIIYNKLLSDNLISKENHYNAFYDYRDGIVKITIDDTEVNMDSIKSTAKEYSKDERRFK